LGVCDGIHQIPSKGNFRADVRMKGIVKNKTFPSEALAQVWADKFEHSIKTIPNLEREQLIALPDAEVEGMGGDELFKQLGVDLFAIRNLAQLEAINTLSKKELLQLSAQEIENMGGAELFFQAGKRIRYKTFREVCGEYLSKWNKKDYVNQLARVNYWCGVFGNRFMTDLDVFDIREYIDDMIEEGIRGTTINRKKAVLSSVFKFAVSRGYIDTNVVRDVIVENDTRQRDRILSADERKRLLKACQESHWDRLYLLVMMAMTTGARKGELLKLSESDKPLVNSDFK
jgi:hypothetical protein